MTLPLEDAFEFRLRTPSSVQEEYHCRASKAEGSALVCSASQLMF